MGYIINNSHKKSLLNKIIRLFKKKTTVTKKMGLLPVFLFMVAVFLLSASGNFAYAAEKVWGGGTVAPGTGGDYNWSTATHWTGDTAPLDGDNIIFDPSTGSGDDTKCTIDASADVDNLGWITTRSTYTKTVTQSANIDVTCGNLDITAGAWTLEDGADISCAQFEIDDATFNCAGEVNESNTITVTGGIWHQDGTFIKGTQSTLKWNGTGDVGFLASASSHYDDFQLTGNGQLHIFWDSDALTIDGDYTQTDGTLWIDGNEGFTVGGTTAISSGTFKVAKSATLTGGVANSGTVELYGSALLDLTVGSGNTFTNSGIVQVTDDSNAMTLQGAEGQFTFMGTEIDYNGKSITFKYIDYDPDVTLGASETIVIGDANCEFDSVTVSAGTLDDSGNYDFTASGNWEVSSTGTFTPGTGTVTLSGTTKTITTNSSNDDDFYNLTVSGSYTLEEDVDANNDLTVTGTLDVKSGENNQVTVAGDFDVESGTFTARSGTVTFKGTGDATVTGNTPFYNLTCTIPGKTIKFDAGSTQTIANNLSLNGQSADTRIILDNDDGSSTRFAFDVTGGAQTVYYVHVSNSNADTNNITAYNSVDGGNNDNVEENAYWIFAVTDSVNVVYDSVRNEAIEGALLTLYTPNGLIYGGSLEPNPQLSKADGTYDFHVEPGQYYTVAKKDNYEDYTSATFRVLENKVERNIPMNPLDSEGPKDPDEVQYLAIRNTVNKTIATIGDILTYTIMVTNISTSSDVASTTVTVSLPHDFKYAPGTTTIDDELSSDPSNKKKPSWSLGTIGKTKTKTLTYRAIIGPDAKLGKNKNYASVTGTVSGSSTQAGPSTAVVDVREGLFCSKELVIGKVFNDKNGNGVQDKGEKGIPHIGLILEDGKTIITDEHGRFSIPEVSLGVHIIRVDPRILPGGPLTKESTLKEWEKPKEETEPSEPLIERRTLGIWIKKSLFKDGKKEEEKEDKEESTLESGYRPEIPHVSKFFRVYETQTTKVNIPLQMLLKDEAQRQAMIDKRDTQFMLIALADGELGYLDARGDYQRLEDGSSEGWKDRVYKDGSLKVYLKGKIKGKYLLTARYDSERDYQDHLFEYINPEKYYPIYGDSSRIYDETDSPGKFYVKLERADSYAMYANYSTEEFTRTELSKYGRTLHGIKTHFETKDFENTPPQGKPNVKIDFFGSETRQDKRQDIIAGRGISGPYFLSRKNIIEYTELIRIEVRDRSRTDIILSSETKTLDLDYEIDYTQGKIIFKEPIPTQDENGDPVYIVVDYEYTPLTRTLEHYIAGVRGEITFGEFGPSEQIPKFKAGSQFVIEQKDMERLRLFGIDATGEIFPGTKISGEWAHSDDLLNKPGDAWRLEGSVRAMQDKFRAQAYAAEIDPNFSNPVNVTESAVQKYGVTAEVEPLKDLSLIVDHYKNRSIKSHTFNRDTKVDLYYEQEKFIFGTGYDFREFVDERGVTYDITTHGWKLQSGFKFTPQLIASGEFKYDEENEEGHWRQKIQTVSPRVDFRLDKNTSVYARHDFVHERTKGQERSYNSNISTIGLMRETKDGVSSYIEYGFVGGGVETTKIGQNVNVPVTEKLSLSVNNSKILSKDKNEENIGYGAKWQAIKDLYVNFLFERNKTTGDERYNSNAKSVAVEYRPEKSSNTIGIKLEERHELEVKEYNLDANTRFAINDSLYLISRGQYQMERDKRNTQTNRLFQRLMGGLAFRPIYQDKLNLLAKYEYTQDLNNTMESELTDYTKHIVSAEAIYDLTSKAELYGRYALKWVGENANAINTYSITDLVTSRLRYKFTDWFDVAGIYHIIKNRNTDTTKQGVQAEAGITFGERVRFAVGWNFVDYDDDEIRDENYTAHGPYLRCSLALMEPELEMITPGRKLTGDEIDNLKEKIVKYRVRHLSEDEKKKLNEKYTKAESLYAGEKYEEAKKLYSDIMLRMAHIRFETGIYIKEELEKGKTVTEILNEI